MKLEDLSPFIVINSQHENEQRNNKQVAEEDHDFDEDEDMVNLRANRLLRSLSLRVAEARKARLSHYLDSYPSHGFSRGLHHLVEPLLKLALCQVAIEQAIMQAK